MKAKSFIYLFFLLVFSQCVTQVQSDGLRPEVAAIVKKIAGYNVHEGELIGIGGRKSSQWKRFQNLCSIASNSELRKLTNDSSGVVRSYAFDGLLMRSDTAVFSIIVNHLHDTTVFKDLNGCIGGNWKVCEYFLLHSRALSLSNRDKLGSIVICDEKIGTSIKDFSLIDLKPEPKYYQHIRKLVLPGDDEIALLALARYKNLNDIGIIKTYLNKPTAGTYTVYAIREFPNVQFYQGLVGIFKKQWGEGNFDNWEWRVLYQALAQYPTQQTLLLFKKTLPAKYEYDNKALAIDRLIALTRYPNPLFENVKNSIKLDEYATNQVNENMYSEK
jgi:hypothetical protein